MRFIPLVRACPEDELMACFRNGGFWSLSDSDPEKIGHQVIVNCGQSTDSAVFQACTYFFAGKVYPDCPTPLFVLVYGAGVEENIPGSVSPFDTGGVWSRHIYPKLSKEDACQLIHDTAVAIESWRREFSQFLVNFFANDPKRYLDRLPPMVGASNHWNRKLPVYCFENWNIMVGDGDVPESRAWTWEIRLHQAIPVVSEHLLFSAATPSAVDKLWKWIKIQKRALRSSAYTDDSLHLGQAVDVAQKFSDKLESLQQQTPEVKYDYVVEVEKKIAEMMK